MINKLIFVRVISCIVVSLVSGCDNKSELIEAFNNESISEERQVSIEFVDKLYSPSTLHLTWCDEPTSSMYVQWLHELENTEASDIPSIAYRKKGGIDWQVTSGDYADFPVREEITDGAFSESPRLYRVHLRNLEPDTRYEFVVLPYKEVYQFETAPLRLTDSITFAVGGDIDVSESAVSVSQQVALRDPLFAVLGGDLSYSNGVDTSREIAWLQQWSRYMKTSHNRLIPMLPVIGNHEVEGYWVNEALSLNEMREKAPFFTALFSCMYPQYSYASIDFGDYLSFLFLDSNHIVKVDTVQTDWLALMLSRRKEVQQIVPVYHVTAYPSVRDHYQEVPELIRNNWVPLFEMEGVRIAFEHHDHAYKRTYPLFQDNINRSRGITYVGDGAWGRSLRVPRSSLEEPRFVVTESEYHAIIVKMNKRGWMLVQAISLDGSVLDDFSILPRSL